MESKLRAETVKQDQQLAKLIIKMLSHTKQQSHVGIQIFEDTWVLP